ncbi:MAG: glycosyltransferase [Thermomicrobiales bacterium]
MSSDYKSLPMILLEARTLIVPCIATNIPGNRAALGEEGSILVARAPKAIADAMFHVANARPQFPKLGVRKYAEIT